MTRKPETQPQSHSVPVVDRALKLAYQAGALAAAILDPDESVERSAPVLSWPALERSDKWLITQACDVLAPFVRRQPEAPPEALYRLAQASRIHDRPPDGWHGLELHWQLAYGLFAQTLVIADRAHAARAADQARLEALKNPQPAKPIPPDERTLRRIDEDDVTQDFGRGGKITEAQPPREEGALQRPSFRDPRLSAAPVPAAGKTTRATPKK